MAYFQVCYVKVLMAVQEKVDKEQVHKTIEQCFPEIDSPIDEVQH